MIGRIAAASASLAIVTVASAGCLSFHEIAVQTPIQAKLDVAPFKRILVAGFVTGGSKVIDPNSETARLLRSQLRSKSELRVVDADALPLLEEFEKWRAASGATAAAPASSTAAPAIQTEEDLKAYEHVFNEPAFWKQIAADHEAPLIITGSILFTEVTQSGMRTTIEPVQNQLGQPDFRQVQKWTDLKGFALTPKFVFIDGRTGQPLYSESFHEETLYPTTTNTPPLSSYFELMDKLLPGFLNTLSSQRIRGTRILLK
jgi:hypothetical protein